MDIFDSIGEILNSLTSSAVELGKLTEKTIKSTGYYVDAYGTCGKGLHKFAESTMKESDAKSSIKLVQLNLDKAEIEKKLKAAK